MSRRWFAFFDDAYELMRKANLPPCSVGTECSEDGWYCCDGGIDRDYVCLPYEQRYQANEKLSEDASLSPGCIHCMPKKSILCTLYPLIPFPSPNGAELILSMLNCEALMQGQEHYEKVLELCIDITRLVIEKHESIASDFIVAVTDEAIGENRASLLLTADGTRNLLKNPSLMKAVMSLQPIKKVMNDKHHRLPVLR